MNYYKYNNGIWMVLPGSGNYSITRPVHNNGVENHSIVISICNWYSKVMSNSDIVSSHNEAIHLVLILHDSWMLIGVFHDTNGQHGTYVAMFTCKGDD